MINTLESLDSRTTFGIKLNSQTFSNNQNLNLNTQKKTCNIRRNHNYNSIKHKLLTSSFFSVQPVLIYICSHSSITGIYLSVLTGQVYHTVIHPAIQPHDNCEINHAQTLQILQQLVPKSCLVNKGNVVQQLHKFNS